MCNWTLSPGKGDTLKIPSITPHTPGIDPLRIQWAEEDFSPEDAESLLEQYSHEDNRK